jgi:hypothetical protein
MNYIATKSLKSKGLAVFLVILFGSLGLFYSSIIGGIIMTLFFPLLVVLLFLSGHIFLAIGLCCMFYIICIIWAINAVNNYNNDVIQNSQLYYDSLNKTPEIETGSDNYPYYKEKNNSLTWLLVSIIILLLVIIGFHYYNKNDSNNSSFTLSHIFSVHKEDKEAIKNIIEKSYLDLMNGGFTSEGLKSNDSEGLPFYNENLKTLSTMALLPIANLLSNDKKTFEIEPKNIQVKDFIDDNSANVEYDLSVTSSGDTKTAHINMLVKKIGGKWKLDANTFMGFDQKKEKRNKYK